MLFCPLWNTLSAFNFSVKNHRLWPNWTFSRQMKIQGQNKQMLAAACQMFLGKSEGEIAHIALETLEGHQRAIIAHLTVEVNRHVRRENAHRANVLHSATSQTAVKLDLVFKICTFSPRHGVLTSSWWVLCLFFRRSTKTERSFPSRCSRWLRPTLSTWASAWSVTHSKTFTMTRSVSHICVVVFIELGAKFTKQGK